MFSLLRSPVLGTLLLGAAPIAAGPFGGGADEVAWDLRAAEHLFNRAGFGARHAELRQAVERGLEQVVDDLLAGPEIPSDPFYARRVGPFDMERDRKLDMLGSAEDDAGRRKVRRRMKQSDLRQLNEFRAFWVERMLSGEDPLRERMTLFWHGYFTSAYRDVKSSYEIIRQIQLLREHALGNFRELLKEVSRDPAMLEYLDSASNVRRHPNENFARELFELFTLGEGNYTEEDVQEAARAFTGWTDQDSEFRFRRGLHDFGKKQVLGVAGRLTGSHVIEIVLERDECARYVAGRILEYFEGVPPDEERRAAYGRFLKESDYELAPFMRRLLSDPAFYRDEIVGQRVAGPIDFLVGHARRLGVRPPGLLVAIGADGLGQKLLDPPSVKGWDEGRAWITTSSVMLRGNLAGLLCGEVTLGEVAGDWDPEDLALDPEQLEMDGEGAMMDGERPAARRFGGVTGIFRHARTARWDPQYHLTSRLQRAGAVRDEEIVAALCDELLAVDVDAETLEWLRMALEDERRDLDIGWRLFFDAGEDAEKGLRRLAHVILSLPEAQVH